MPATPRSERGERDDLAAVGDLPLAADREHDHVAGRGRGDRVMEREVVAAGAPCTVNAGPTACAEGNAGSSPRTILRPGRRRPRRRAPSRRSGHVATFARRSSSVAATSTAPSRVTTTP